MAYCRHHYFCKLCLGRKLKSNSIGCVAYIKGNNGNFPLLPPHPSSVPSQKTEWAILIIRSCLIGGLSEYASQGQSRKLYFTISKKSEENYYLLFIYLSYSILDALCVFGAQEGQIPNKIYFIAVRCGLKKPWKISNKTLLIPQPRWVSVQSKIFRHGSASICKPMHSCVGLRADAVPHPGVSSCFMALSNIVGVAVWVEIIYILKALVCQTQDPFLGYLA